MSVGVDGRPFGDTPRLYPDAMESSRPGDSNGERGNPDAPALLARRIAAYLVDIVILAAALGVVHFAIHHLVHDGKRPEFTRNGWLLEAYTLGTVSLPVWIYFTLLESSRRGATLGKRLLGLRVSGLDGEPLTRTTAFGRTLFKLLPWELTHVAMFCPVPMWDAPNEAMMRPLFMLSTFLVGSWLVTAMLTEHQQAPHDLVMKTVVARTASRPEAVR
jgi:uncharacterized RDD family membrane protein YckC